MLQLKEVVSDFLDMKFAYLDEENALDEGMLSAINDRDGDSERRRQVVAHWLFRYSVLRIRSVTGLQMAEKILAFADSQREPQKQLSREQLKLEFRRLESALRVGVPALNGDKHRSIDSLTSKALWCLYPNDAPILDGYAECALMVLTRLCKVSAPPLQKRYETFMDSWFLIHDEIKGALALADSNVYPYPLRVMDRFLWWLGQPRFESFTHSDSSMEAIPPEIVGLIDDSPTSARIGAETNVT